MVNQCVICGAEMGEGDQVCRGCVGNKPTGEIRFTEDRLLFYWKDAKFEIPSVYWLAEAVREKMEREVRG